MMNSRYSLLIKIVTLFVLAIVMLIPTRLIMGIVDDRFYYQNEVIESVSRSSSGEQTIVGPIIAIPYIETNIYYEDSKQIIKRTRNIHYILPKTLDVKAKVDVAPRYIGIYQTQNYQSDLEFKGMFEATSFVHEENIELDEPYAVVLISDTRGIMQIPVMNIDQKTINFEPGIKENGFTTSSQLGGIHVPISFKQLENSLSYNFSLKLQGMNRLAIVPVGQSTQYQLDANWPHPNFLGFSLPTKRQINEKGFSAEWQSTWYANNINSLFAEDSQISEERYKNKVCGSYVDSCMPMFKASFIEPVDQYQLTKRAIKYDILFTVLIFVSFFIFEILKQIKIHPVQYLLVGMALAIFYLLLLAASEHIGFTLAYIIGALACSILIGFYLSAVLKSIKWSCGFTVFLLTLYACLYIVMNSEGNSLLFGTTLLFLVLSGIMILTRHIDWYSVAKIDLNNIDKVTPINEQSNTNPESN